MRPNPVKCNLCETYTNVYEWFGSHRLARNCNVLSLLEADNYKYQGYLLLPSYMLTYRFPIPVLGVEV